MYAARLTAATVNFSRSASRSPSRTARSMSSSLGDLVEVTDLRGGFRREPPTVEHELESLVGSDEAHEALGAAAAGREAEQDLGLADHVVAAAMSR